MTLIVAAALTLFIGLGCGLGGVALWNGKPDNWPDVVASDAVVRRTARMLVVVGAALLVSGVGTLFRSPAACVTAAVSVFVFVIGGFWGNYALFGNFRPKHTVTNAVLAAIVWWLIWIGFPDA